MKTRLPLVLAIFSISCAGVDGLDGEDGAAGANGQDGRSFIVDVEDVEPGDECPIGGQRLIVGEDLNNDGALAPLEITKDNLFCQPQSAAETVVNTEEEPPSPNCGQGGIRLDIGTDSDGDGILSASEVKSTEYVCNGTNGLNGADGEDGQDGSNGQDGTNGQDGSDGQSGLSALVATQAEAPGANCVAGGVRITSGLDQNRNGVLESGEVTSTRYVCNGTGGNTNQPFSVYAFAGHSNPVYFNGLGANTLISAQINLPAAGSVVATGSVDFFCDTFATTSQTYCSTTEVEAYLALTANASSLQTFSDFNTTDGHFFGFLAKDTTNHISTTRVFDFGPGPQTITLRALNDNTGRLGAWRATINLVYLPD